MSWISRIQNIPLEITTGDGKTYTPIFNNASDSTPVNESIFEFIDKKGGLVVRGEIGIKQFNVQLHFTGSDNIDTVEEFEKSAEDKRPWTLKHPFYGIKTVQPSTLNYDRNNLNDIIFTTTLYETITDEQPTSEIDVQTDVIESVNVVSESAIVNAEQVNQSVTERIIEKLTNGAVTDEDYQNVISAGNDALNNISDATSFMRSSTELLRTPAKFYDNVNDRIRTLEEAFNELITAAVNLPNYYENTGAVIVTAICESSVILSSDVSSEQNLPELANDFKTRNDVLGVINKVSETSIDFFNELTVIQNNSYLPNYTLIRNLFATINKTIGQLFILAQNALQERNYLVDSETTLITLHHRLYGNSDSDSIKEFAEYNSIGISELLTIPEGRNVKYFV